LPTPTRESSKDWLGSTTLREWREALTAIRRLMRPGFLACIILGLVAITFLPYFIPSAPTASDSYLFGYNNRAGILLLLALVAVGVIWTKGMNLQFLSRGTSAPVSVEVLIFSLVTVACGCAIMWAFAGRYEGFGESFYVIDRAWLVAAGKAPFRDAEFAYGPAMLYVPILLHSIFSISIAQAYYIFWAGSYLLGTYLLYKTVNLVDYPSPTKQEIYLLLFLTGLFAIVRMGTNYTFLRFVCPLFFVLVIQKWLLGCAGRWGIRAFFGCVAFAVILISLSPETAIAFAFACTWLVAFSRTEPVSRRAARVTVLLAAFLLLFLWAKELHILDTLLADGSGAINFPIMPAPHILVFFAAVFVCACYLYWRVRDRQINDNTIGLIGYSVPMLGAALGRCDPSHVFWNGMAIFLASMFYVSHQRAAWRAYRVAFLLFVFLLPSMSELYLFLPQLRAIRFLNEHGNGLAGKGDVAMLYTGWSGGFYAPFGYRSNGFGTYRSSRVSYGRFEGVIDVSTPRAVEEKVAEIREHPDWALIVPYDYEIYCQVDPIKERHYLTVLMLFPHLERPVHPLDVRNAICETIRSEYRLAQEPSKQSLGYGLWVPKKSNP